VHVFSARRTNRRSVSPTRQTNGSLGLCGERAHSFRRRILWFTALVALVILWRIFRSWKFYRETPCLATCIHASKFDLSCQYSLTLDGNEMQEHVLARSEDREGCRKPFSDVSPSREVAVGRKFDDGHAFEPPSSQVCRRRLSCWLVDSDWIRANPRLSDGLLKRVSQGS
jgi:hypothetical protein